MIPSQHETEWMGDALSLAGRGRGHVEPNPMVGCVIVRNGQVIGSGYHQQFGQPHAEPNALASCTEAPAGASAIVTLEPCCHTNKKTPPCVPALIRAGIRRVVIGHLDPNPAVSGQGAAQLREAGMQVVVGVLEEQCRQLNAPFFALVRHGRPYVTLKWAQSADGLMGGSGNTHRHISNRSSSRLVHELRTRCDGILVSVDTVLCDDPILSVRHVPVIRQPARVVVDTHLRIPETCQLVCSAGEIPTHVFTGQESEKARRLRTMGVMVHAVGLRDGHVDLDAMLQELGRLRFTHLLVEPGPRLARVMLERNLADRVWVIRSPHPLAEANAPVAPAVPFAATAERNIEGDKVTEHLNPESPVFFDARVSPEFWA